MARRRRPPTGSVVTGDVTILGQLAQYYRLGQFGAISPGEPEQAGRPRLDTPRDIIRTLRARHELPTRREGHRWSWSYICRFVDDSSGEEIGRTRQLVETAADASYQKASAAARRASLANLPRCVQQAINEGHSVTMTCRRIGQILDLPTQ